HDNQVVALGPMLSASDRFLFLEKNRKWAGRDRARRSQRRFGMVDGRGPRTIGEATAPLEGAAGSNKKLVNASFRPSGTHRGFARGGPRDVCGRSMVSAPSSEIGSDYRRAGPRGMHLCGR